MEVNIPLYFAIISICLAGVCSSVEDKQRFIFEYATPFHECIKIVDMMVKQTRERFPEAKHRPIATLCVRLDVLEGIENYKIWKADEVET